MTILSPKRLPISSMEPTDMYKQNSFANTKLIYSPTQFFLISIHGINRSHQLIDPQ